VLGNLPVYEDDRVLVDYRTSDDAGVYRLDAGRALVQTVDFFTPIVDDPFVYGQIAAANALSDVYAMGGRPLTALAIAAFPSDLDHDILKQVFAGGLDKLREAGVALLGGHTVQDKEIKFGYAVTGEVNPERVLANGGAAAGDVLLLTKPIGTGVIATALKFERAPARSIDAAIRSMTTLNRAAAEVIVPYGTAVHACTDVTGFGLIGHGAEMAASSRCSLQIHAASVPLIDGALALVRGNIPGGGRTNREHFGSRVSVAEGVAADLVDLLYDPQTSGGLLVAVEPSRADAICSALIAAGVAAVRIGHAVPPANAAILVV
jgi:selenide, water dikinase